MNNNSSIRPKRRWSSIRLGYLLLAVTAVGFVLGQWISPALSQQKLVSQIHADGGWVLVSPKGDAAPSVVLKHFFPLDALIPIHAVGFESNFQMELPASSIRSLQQMPTVTRLFLRGAIVSSDALDADTSQLCRPFRPFPHPYEFRGLTAPAEGVPARRA